MLLLSASYLRESTGKSWAKMAEPLVEVSRPGCESLDFKLTDINPSTVANAFCVSIAMATTNTEFQGPGAETTSNSCFIVLVIRESVDYVGMVLCRDGAV